MLERWCWNWQTGMVEGHVPQGVRVRPPPSAFNIYFSSIYLIFLESRHFRRDSFIFYSHPLRIGDKNLNSGSLLFTLQGGKKVLVTWFQIGDR